jgi:hypothetical protein
MTILGTSRTTIVGEIYDDPKRIEGTQAATGNAYAFIKAAINVRSQRADGTIHDNYYDISANHSTNTMYNYNKILALKKGDLVQVSGELWPTVGNKQDGTPIVRKGFSKFGIDIQTIKKNTHTAAAPANTPQEAEDDIPF